MSDTWTQPRRVPYEKGIVTAQQLTPYPAVRVQLPDRDNMITYWLPISTGRASKTGDFFYSMPDVGDQVSVVMDEHYESGYVSGSLPSTVDTTPSGASLNMSFYVQTKDGTTFAYDRNAHSLAVAFTGAGGSASISLSGGSTFELNADGTVLVQDKHGSKIAMDNAGNVNITGNLTVTGTITEGFGTGSTVGVSTHDHTGGTISGKTGPPIPNT